MTYRIVPHNESMFSVLWMRLFSHHMHLNTYMRLPATLAEFRRARDFPPMEVIE